MRWREGGREGGTQTQDRLTGSEASPTFELPSLPVQGFPQASLRENGGGGLGEAEEAA